MYVMNHTVRDSVWNWEIS